MRLDQANELFTLITTVRHVEEMDRGNPFIEYEHGCLLCEGIRHGLYSNQEGRSLSVAFGFAPHFGCTIDEATKVIFHFHISPSSNTTGQNYYTAGKELLEKYGYGHLFESIKPKAMSFKGLMKELQKEAA